MSTEIFTPDEQKVIAAYQNPELSGIGRATRLSAQYLLATGAFTYWAISENKPLYSLVTYGVFFAWVVIRLVKARRLAGIMPRVLGKYQQRVSELEAELAGRPQSQAS